MNTKGRWEYIIVDLDDTLLFTSAYNTYLYCDIIRELTGLSLHQLCAPDLRITSDTVREVFAHYKEGTRCTDAIIERKNSAEVYTEGNQYRREDLIGLNTTVVELLEQQTRAKKILLSNGNTLRVKYLWDYFRIDRYCESFYCNPSPKKNKYLYIKDLLKLEPERCLVLENEPHQINLAREAGFLLDSIVHIDNKPNKY